MKAYLRAMDIILDLLIALSLITVVGSFVIGMIAFARNGSQAAETSNRFMAWRVKTQVIAVAVLLISAWARGQHSV